jgi:hypothetical protein
MTTDERVRRIGLNEAVFREVNDRVEELNRDLGVPDDRLELLCECGDPGCVERISMTISAYAALRADSRQFAVVPGHDLPEVETVVFEHGDYDVVRKHAGEPTRVAEETDPRS